MKIVVPMALLAAALSGMHLHAQVQDDGWISIRLVLEEAEDQGTFPQRSYRVYGEPNTLRARFTLNNESESPIVVDQVALQKVFRMRLRAESEIPLVVQWLPEIYLPGETPWIPISNSLIPILIESHTGPSWTIAFERANGMAFVRGEYVLEYEIPGLRSAVRKADDTPWIGRAPDVWPGRLELFLAPASTTREQATMHNVVATDAMLRRAVGDAAAAYSRALAADPTDGTAIVGLGTAFLIHGRYAEAIPLFEQVLPRGPAEAIPLFEQVLPRGPSESLVFSRLAQAYLGVGDEQNALRVLRMSGLPEGRIASEVAQLRRAIRGRP